MDPNKWQELKRLDLRPLRVVAFQVAASGTYCILEDGRMYQLVADQWVVYAPPLTTKQRTPR